MFGVLSSNADETVCSLGAERHAQPAKYNPFKNDTQSHQQRMDSPQQLGFDPPSVSMMLARVGLMLIIEAVHMRAGDEPLSNQPPNNKFFSLETL